MGTPKRIATKDANRPIPENNAIMTSGLPSDFLELSADAETGVEMRAAFGMSGSPIREESKSLPIGDVFAFAKRFNASTQNWKIPALDDGTDRHNYDAIFRQSAIIIYDFAGFHLSEIDRPPSSSAALHDKLRLPRSRNHSSASMRAIPSRCASRSSL
jgi:hypothetical protein